MQYSIFKTTNNTTQEFYFDNEIKLNEFLISEGFNKGNLIDFLRVRSYKIKQIQYRLEIVKATVQSIRTYEDFLETF